MNKIVVYGIAVLLLAGVVVLFADEIGDYFNAVEVGREHKARADSALAVADSATDRADRLRIVSDSVLALVDSLEAAADSVQRERDLEDQRLRDRLASFQREMSNLRDSLTVHIPPELLPAFNELTRLHTEQLAVKDRQIQLRDDRVSDLERLLAESALAIDTLKLERDNLREANEALRVAVQSESDRADHWKKQAHPDLWGRLGGALKCIALSGGGASLGAAVAGSDNVVVGAAVGGGVGAATCAVIG